jgi:hypothetical protein
MASYIPPREILTIFNPYDWRYGETILTINTGDQRYVRLTANSITTSNIILNSTSIISQPWDTSSNTHTITSSNLACLANSNFIGEMVVSCKDSNTSLGYFRVVLSRPTSSNLVITSSTKVSNLSTFTIVNSSNNILVSTTPNCSISWIYYGTTS